MKKLIRISALLSLIASTASAQMPEYEYVPEIPKGKVKTLTRIASQQQILAGKEMNSVDQKVFHFDKEGKVVEVHTKSSSDGITDNIPGAEYVTTYTYNEKGLLISQESTYKGQQNPFRVITYTYDEQSREIKRLYENFQSSDATHIMYKITYNNAGSKDEVIAKASSSDGSFTEKEKWQYKYDDLGREIERYYYDYEAKRYWKDQSVVYDDASGKEIEKLQYHTDGSVYIRTKHTYNSEGTLESTNNIVNGKQVAPAYVASGFKDTLIYY